MAIFGRIHTQCSFWFLVLLSIFSLKFSSCFVTECCFCWCLPLLRRKLPDQRYLIVVSLLLSLPPCNISASCNFSAAGGCTLRILGSVGGCFTKIDLVLWLAPGFEDFLYQRWKCYHRPLLFPTALTTKMLVPGTQYLINSQWIACKHLSPLHSPVPLRVNIEILTGEFCGSTSGKFVSQFMTVTKIRAHTHKLA